YLEQRAQPVGVGFIGPHYAEIPRLLVELHDVAQERSHHSRRLGGLSAGTLYADRVFAKIAHLKGLEQQSPVGVWIGAHAARALGRQGSQLGPQAAPLVEQFLRAIAVEPLIEDLDLLRRGHVGHRYLVRAAVTLRL